MSSITLQNTRTWPVREALRVLERMRRQVKTGLAHKAFQASGEKLTALFETGYSPSGLPHLGTVGEIIRVLMVKKAFDVIADGEFDSKLVAFIDDMDGLRKVPTNVPQQDMMKQYLGFPLTKIPDPFGCCDSFAHHNTGRLKHVLKEMNLLHHITFCSSTDFYTHGHFNTALAQVLKHNQQVMDLMLPTLGDERQQTYSPFLPISPQSGKVLQVPIQSYNTGDHTISFQAEDGEIITQTILDGHCKLQWKPDFGMRWFALGIDYEMYGKDLIHTVELSRKICEILGGTPPINMHYELFLSDTGGRISKSKGNESLTLLEWVKYTPRGCLEYFLFQNPQRAKRIRAEDIPVYVENYLQHLVAFKTQNQIAREENPIYYIEASNQYMNCDINLSYKMALSMACAYNVMDLDSFKALFIHELAPEHILDEHIIESAYHYYQEQIQAEQVFERIPQELTEHCNTLIELLEAVPGSTQDLKDAYQTIFFQVAREASISMSVWFEALYKAILGTSYGPKLGTFCAMYGVRNFCAKLKSML